MRIEEREEGEKPEFTLEKNVDKEVSKHAVRRMGILLVIITSTHALTLFMIFGKKGT